MNLMCLSVGGRSDMIQSLSSVLIWLKILLYSMFITVRKLVESDHSLTFKSNIIVAIHKQLFNM